MSQTKEQVVVIGGSAGAIETLVALVSELPADLAAAVFVTVHTSPTGPGRLPAVLQRATLLPVAHAIDGERVESRRIYVAPPDHHLVFDDGHIRVTRGPKENHTRPAIDPMFRSAAVAYGRRAIAVVLTGTLDDGAAGLCDIKERGGRAVVQDPQSALFPDMPRNAIARTFDTARHVDFIVPRQEIPHVITRLVNEPVGDSGQPEQPASRQMQIETRIALEEMPLKAGVMELGPTSPFTCPECHGVLLQVGGAQSFRYRCHTGHAFSAETLLATQETSTDEAIWSAVRAMEERVMLMRTLMQRAQESGKPDIYELWAKKADALQRKGESLRQVALTQSGVMETTPHGEA